MERRLPLDAEDILCCNAHQPRRSLNMSTNVRIQIVCIWFIDKLVMIRFEGHHECLCSENRRLRFLGTKRFWVQASCDVTEA